MQIYWEHGDKKMLDNICLKMLGALNICIAWGRTSVKVWVTQMSMESAASDMAGIIWGRYKLRTEYFPQDECSMQRPWRERFVSHAVVLVLWGGLFILCRSTGKFGLSMNWREGLSWSQNNIDGGGTAACQLSEQSFKMHHLCYG